MSASNVDSERWSAFDDFFARCLAEIPKPDAPTDPGLQSVDSTGVITGNADLEASCTWSPPTHSPEQPPQVWPLPAEVP